MIILYGMIEIWKKWGITVDEVTPHFYREIDF